MILPVLSCSSSIIK